MTKEKAIAYAEVYQIIQYLPEEEYRLIAKEQIEYIKNNMAPNVKKICTINTNIKDIELSEEARNILLALFYMNVATDKQRKQLEMFLNKKEQENLIKFDEKEFFAKKNNTYGVDKNSNRNAGSAINNVNDIKENVVVNEQNDEEQGKKENEDSNYEITKKFKELKNQLDEQQSQITPEFKEMYQKLFGTKIEDKPKEEKEQQDNLDAVDIVKDNVSMFENIGTYQKPAYKFIGIVFKTYIIVEIDKEMYIIDQHAAHERIMYEKVKNNYYSDSSKDSQMLLLPDIITLQCLIKQDFLWKSLEKTQ